MQTARRIAALPPYLFAEIDRRVAAAKAAGVDVISFGVGDPDLPTPGFIVEELARAARDPSTHQYPSYFGLPELREAIADFYEQRFGLRLDPATQVLPLIGSKEGIAHLPWAFVDPGEPVLVTEPGYPVYEIGTILAGGGRDGRSGGGRVAVEDLQHDRLARRLGRRQPGRDRGARAGEDQHRLGHLQRRA